MKKQKFFRFNQFDGTDLIALVVIVGGFILMAMKIDTVVGVVVTSVAAYYFGRKTNSR